MLAGRIFKMTTRDLGQQTNELIQKEHSLFRHFSSIKTAYEMSLQDIKNNFGRNKEEVQRAWERTQSNSNAELEQIRQLMGSAQVAVGSSPWRDKAGGGIPATLIAARSANVDINQQIGQCRSAAFQSHQELMNFLRTNQTPSTSNAGWLSAGVGCLIFLLEEDY